jgi:DNA-binding beta-propeller fold protein YncE
MTPSFRQLALLLLACLIGGGSARGQLSAIAGTAIDVDISGKITVIDRRSAHVRQYSPEGALLTEIGGNGWSSNQFDRPSGLWARNGIDVYIADEGNHRVQRFDRDLNFISSFSTRESTDPDRRFGYPRGVSVSRHGELFILDGENQRVLKVNRANEVERTFGGFDAGSGKLGAPRALQIGPHDHVYVLDGERVVVFDAFGNFVHLLPLGDQARPSCLYADESGVIVVGESGITWLDANERVVGVSPLPDAMKSPVEVTGVAIRARSAYLLSTRGLVVEPAPDAWGGLE